MPGSTQSSMAEALLQVNDACYHGRLSVRMDKLITGIVKEYSTKASEDYAEGMRHLHNLCSRLGLSKILEDTMRRFPNRPVTQTRRPIGIDRFSELTLDGASLGVQNVYDCSVLTGRLLGDEYARPLTISTYGLFTRVITSLHYRILSRFLIS